MGRLGVAIVVILAACVLASPAEAGRGPAFRYIPAGKIGKTGTGPGAFPRNKDGPVGIAVDQRCGDVYVSDASKQRVQRFNQHGKFLNYVGRPQGDENLSEGELHSPEGLDVYVAVTSDNFHGPPTPCGVVTTLSTYVFVADPTGNRVAKFDPGGSWQGSWCAWDQNGTITGCDFADDRIDFYPGDVDVTANSVYVAGQSGSTAREYDRGGNFRRESDPPVDGAYSLSRFGGQLWMTERYDSRIGLFSLDPSNDKISRYHQLGSDFDSAAGKFTYPQALATALNGTLYVLDDERVEVFTPSGIYLTQFKLPVGSRGSDIAVRHDGTVYVADDRHDPSRVLAYSPGPLVSLKLKAMKHRKIKMTGRVKPSHAGRTIKLQRLAQNGWRVAGKTKLDKESHYELVWTAPRKEHTYTIRAFFKDPHRYHDDRTSQIKQVKSR
jgi:DNA-binding beta-propeller fold protein YncE